MINKLKKMAVAMLLTGATVMTSSATTLYQSVNVDLVLTYYQNAGVTNSKGDVTFAADNLKLTTPEFVGLLATNLGIANLSKSAQLMRVTSLYQGTNVTSFTTNLNTLQAGYTLLTNIEIPLTIVWQCSTNPALFYTNNYTGSPSVATGPIVSNVFYDTPYSVTNFHTFVIQGKTEPVILGSATYYIVNGPNITDTNLWIPLYSTNNSSYVNVSAPDEAENFQNNSVYPNLGIDDQNNFFIGNTNYFGDYYNPPTNFVFDMTGLLTNLSYNAYGGTNYGPVFVGVVKTNEAITGTLFGNSIYLSTGDSAQPNGIQNFLTALNLTGFGNSTSTTSPVGKGRAALPFTSWNSTFTIPMGLGNATLGGYDTNSTNINFAYVYVDSSASNGVAASVEKSPGFTNPTTLTNTTGTNPPPMITNSYTYANGTNTAVFSPAYNGSSYFTTGSPGYGYFYLPAPTTANITIQVTTPDLTGYYDTNLVLTNVATNVYTLNSSGSLSNNYLNYNIFNPTTTSFEVSGSVKVTTVKIGNP